MSETTDTTGLPARVEEPRGVAVGRAWLIPPANLREAMELAKVLAASTFVPKDLRGEPGNVLCAIQFGAEVGLPPLQALQGIAVINGRPAVWGDAAMAIVEASGLLADKQETLEGEGTALVAVCRVQRRGRSEPCERRFGVADAKAAKLWEKEGPWRSYPHRMLQMRARSWALRDEFADVLRGLSIREEVADIPVPAAPETVPLPRRLATPIAPAPAPAAGVADEAPAPPEDANGGNDEPNAVISETQRKRLIVVCKEHGHDFDALKGWCRDRGVTSTTLIPQRLYEAALAWAHSDGTGPIYREPGQDG